MYVTQFSKKHGMNPNPGEKFGKAEKSLKMLGNSAVAFVTAPCGATAFVFTTASALSASAAAKSAELQSTLFSLYFF